MTTDYKVKLDIFEGPLDLLLHLIRQNEMEISEISISAITSQYLDYLRLMETLDLEVAGDFLVMAATLLNIKLRALLPATEEEAGEEQEEELDNFMSARQLMQRLIEYRKFKEAGQELGNRAERQAQIFIREVALPALKDAQEDEELYKGDLQTLLEAFARIIKFIDRRDYHQVQAEEYRIEDKITLFRRRLVTEPRLALSEVFRECRAKLEMIVTVIAILELCRLKELRVRQNDRFGEVFIFRTDEAPEEEYDVDLEKGDGAGKRRAKKLAAAVALERIEAEIMANRTGFIDDGVIPDDEDALLDEMMREQAGESTERVESGSGAQAVTEANAVEDSGPDATPAIGAALESPEPGAAEEFQEIPGVLENLEAAGQPPDQAGARVIEMAGAAATEPAGPVHDDPAKADSERPVIVAEELKAEIQHAIEQIERALTDDADEASSGEFVEEITEVQGPVLVEEIMPTNDDLAEPANSYEPAALPDAEANDAEPGDQPLPMEALGEGAPGMESESTEDRQPRIIEMDAFKQDDRPDTE